MATITSLPEAVHELVQDGTTIALEGFSHLVPFAAGHEILRQGHTDLHLIRMVPDIIADQLIGAGRVARLTFSWAGNPGVGSLHRFRDAIEHDWPRPMEIDEHTHAALANAYSAGAASVPFAVFRGYLGTDLLSRTPSVRPIRCPFTGRALMAVRAVNPTVSVIHAQRADRRGNVQLWGALGVQREAVLAAASSLVTVEELVDELAQVPGGQILPAWCVTFVAVAPSGASPSYTEGYTSRDDDFYLRWDDISRDRERFLAWIQDHILGENPARPFAPAGRQAWEAS